MDPDEDVESLKRKAESLQKLTTGSVTSSTSRLSASSRRIPSNNDFHFFYNFPEFKSPINEISQQSQSMLEEIGYSEHIWGKQLNVPHEFDDDTYDWLVNVNDEVFERFDVSLDEFHRSRKQQEQSDTKSINMADAENGFQLVYGKKKKKEMRNLAEKEEGTQDLSVKVASRDKKISGGTKARIPFHIPTIPRPQDVFKILVNNSNQPFEHVWLQKSEDGTRSMHPLEKLSVLDFVDKDVEDLEPVAPPPMESTPFKLVEEVRDLKDLAAKLRGVNEFAVDLEHNQYRSFQGMTCLMQISTRTEDFVIDTLKLRIYIGPHLREVFKDPTKRKVMHGADRDIFWLQRDFGIYICNLFDTGQASRILKLERNSLEYLLQHFCAVTANKEYQNADWRLRPLPDEMLRYAREDTHYLLYIYDIMRVKLLSTAAESENSDPPILEAYKRSYDVCIQLYEKELLTESSYLHIYGLQGAEFNAEQLAIVAGLCEWRDAIARAEDESTGYILPNRSLLEIAKQMPVTTSMLRRLLKTKHPYVERNLGQVVSIIRLAIQNAAAFEDVAQQLKRQQIEVESEESKGTAAVSETLQVDVTASLATANSRTQQLGVANDGNVLVQLPVPGQPTDESLELVSSRAQRDGKVQEGSVSTPVENGEVKNDMDNFVPAVSGVSSNILEQTRDTDCAMSKLQPTKINVSGATVQVLKKPSRAFGAMLGNPAAKKKINPTRKETEEIKLEQIKSSVNLMFHSFSGSNEQLKPFVEDHSKALEVPNSDKSIAECTSIDRPEDVILLEGHSSGEESIDGDARAANDQLGQREDNCSGSASEGEKSDESLSLSDLSSSFQKCFRSINEKKEAKKSRQVKKSPQSGGFLQVEPFDYEAARKQVRFGGNREDKSDAER
ncbi:Exosome-associated factor Rrp6, N-terminal [Dillenia turbinata]|uniref:Exosome-associated factor Rrp6, N-terminal n=1 Tax=Dillenia turbinata TaxID=194707 RepID=A0AAN8ZQT9_9MAGN